MEKRALFGIFKLLLRHKLIEVAFRILKKKVFVRLMGVLVAVLFLIRLCFPGVNSPRADTTIDPPPSEAVEETAVEETATEETTAEETATEETAAEADSRPAVPQPELRQGTHDELHAENDVMPLLDFSYRHPIRSVHSYADCFPDVQDVQYPAARKNGVRPVANRLEAEARKRELLYIGNNPYYAIDPAMRSSIPYLVPRASQLLQHIGRRFLDSLAVKQIPLHTIIVTSVLRTEEDVARLRRINGNANDQSCHRFGTTFDISYNRYHTVSPPGEDERRAVRNDTLKYILSEVLRDARSEGRCFVKYEVKQACFHITVR